MFTFPQGHFSPQINGGLRFIKSDFNYVRCPPINDILGHDKIWSISASFTPTSSPEWLVFGNIYNSTNPYGYLAFDRGWHIIFGNNIQRITFANSGADFFYWEHNIALNVGARNYISMLSDGSSNINSIKLYVNGNLINTSPPNYINNLSVAMYQQGFFNTLGAYFTTTALYNSITIDHFKIFNRALNAQEVSAIAANQRIIANVLDYEFEDRQGTSLLDTSGNFRNGTLFNFLNTIKGTNNQWVDKFGNPILN